MMLRPIAICMLLSLMAAACQGKERAPYYQPSRPDASDSELSDGGPSVETADPPNLPKPSASEDPPPDADAAVPPEFGDKITRATFPAHKSTSCADFSSGAVHSLAWGHELGIAFSELWPDTTQNGVCGGLEAPEDPEDVYLSNVRIRRSDGRLLYLYNGFIYRFVPDETPTESKPAAGWQRKNDIKQSVVSPCGNGTSTQGPFRSFLIQPNGKLIFECASASPSESTYQDQNGKVVGSWDQRVYAFELEVDDDGKLVRLDDPINNNGTTVQAFYDHGVKPPLKVVGGPRTCMDIAGGASIFAIRALSSGFLLGVRNACGFQLWRTYNSSIEYLASYWQVDEAPLALSSNYGYAQIANGGMLFFEDELRIDGSRAVYCGKSTSICALAPFVKAPDSLNVIQVRPWLSGWELL